MKKIFLVMESDYSGPFITPTVMSIHQTRQGAKAALESYREGWKRNVPSYKAVPRFWVKAIEINPNKDKIWPDED